MDFDGHDAQPALNMAADAAVNRGHELKEFDTTRDERDSDDNGDANTSIINAVVVRGGTETLISTINFSRNEFGLVWHKIQPFIVAH